MQCLAGQPCAQHKDVGQFEKMISFVRWPSRKIQQSSPQHIERLDILHEAFEFGQSAEGKRLAGRHLTIIYNPVSGAGCGDRIRAPSEGPHTNPIDPSARGAGTPPSGAGWPRSWWTTW